MAQLLGIDPTEPAAGRRSTLLIAIDVRKALLRRAVLPEEMFDPLMAAAVHEPDAGFCRWFVEPEASTTSADGAYRTALLQYLREGTDAERAGAVQAWYWSAFRVREGRSQNYASGTVRDPEIDQSQDIVDGWLETAMRIVIDDPHEPICPQLVWMLPHAHKDYPPQLRELFARTLATVETNAGHHISQWDSIANVTNTTNAEPTANPALIDRTNVG